MTKAIWALVGSLFVTACGDAGTEAVVAASVDPETKVVATGTSTSPSIEPISVLLASELPACTTDNEGQMAYVHSLQVIKFCLSDNWSTADLSGHMPEETPDPVVAEPEETPKEFELEGEYSFVNTDKFCDDYSTDYVTSEFCGLTALRVYRFTNGMMYYSATMMITTSDNDTGSFNDMHPTYTGWIAPTDETGLFMFYIGIHKQGSGYYPHYFAFSIDDLQASVVADINENQTLDAGIDVDVLNGFDVYQF